MGSVFYETTPMSKRKANQKGVGDRLGSSKRNNRHGHHFNEIVTTPLMRMMRMMRMMRSSIISMSANSFGAPPAFKIFANSWNRCHVPKHASSILGDVALPPPCYLPQSMTMRPKKPLLFAARITLLVFVALLFCACAKKEDNAKGGPSKGKLAFPVELITVVAERVEYTVSAVGSVDAFERVQLTARVAGVVEHVRFSEGDVVKKGTVIVEIDPARYNLAVRRAKASLDRALATEAEAKMNLARRDSSGAENEGLFSKEDIDGWRTRLRTSSAQAAEARALLDEANLNLRDAYVRAPIDGKMQTRTVQTGQFVQAGTVLGTALQRDPLLLRFSVPEADAPSLHTGMIARFKVTGDERMHSAKITLVTDASEPSTRMVPVICEIDSEHKDSLRPGTFADVTVPIGSNDAAPVIPQTAIRPSEKGFLAFVIKNDVAEERVLTLGMRTADGRVEVRKGLSPGEQLVVRGAEPLKQGTQVKVSQAKPSGPASASSAGSSASSGAPAPKEERPR
jgi:membrane fusion protein, multidrug efflux system